MYFLNVTRVEMCKRTENNLDNWFNCVPNHQFSVAFIHLDEWWPSLDDEWYSLSRLPSRLDLWSSRSLCSFDLLWPPLSFCNLSIWFDIVYSPSQLLFTRHTEKRTLLVIYVTFILLGGYPLLASVLACWPAFLPENATGYDQGS